MTEAELEGQHAGGLGEPGSQLGWQDPEAELVSVQNSTEKQRSAVLYLAPKRLSAMRPSGHHRGTRLSLSRSSPLQWEEVTRK